MSTGLKYSHIITPIGLICGLCMFFLGMKVMSVTFEGFVSYEARRKINAITSSKLLGVFLGVVMTALLQSSSATTLVLVSLVHGNVLSIYNAVPIIMGSNIGTTFTAQLISYSIDSLIPYMYLIGIALLPLYRSKPCKVISKLMLSLALIFSGMWVMSFSMNQIQSSKLMLTLINYVESSKISAILSGVVFTAIIQSSSAGVAILQVMASSKLLSVLTAIPMILGQNIGTCVDTVIGSIATNKAGKQVAIVHVLFNIIGVIIFYFLINPLYSFVCFLTPENPVRQIANAHTIFNAATTLLLLPFSSILIYISKRIIKE